MYLNINIKHTQQKDIPAIYQQKLYYPRNILGISKTSQGYQNSRPVGYHGVNIGYPTLSGI